MAVMNKMREFTKIILYILVLAFIGTIIFDWGMNYSGKSAAENVVGEVNGVEISLREFDQAFNNQLQQFRSQTDAELTENQVELIRNQVWNSMVQQILVDQTVEKSNIEAADAEIVYRLFHAPPDFLRTLPGFQNENQQFDMAKYQQAINDPSTAEQWRPIEAWMRDYLPREKFEQRLQASVRVTEDEVRREYLKRNQNAKVKYIFINPRMFEDVQFEITDDMIQQYYNAHKEEYRQPEQRAIEYVIFSTEPTAADTAAKYDEANRVLQKAKEGEDFAELARTYSEHEATRDKGGDLNYFAKGDLSMFASFEDELFNASIGETIGPVKSNLGLHLIKVVDKRTRDNKEELKASHILFKFTPSRRTTEQARDDAEYLVEQAQSEPFSELVTELGDSVRTTGLFVKGLFVPGIGRNESIVNFTFANNVGSIGPIIELDEGLLVFRVSEIKKESLKPLDEVRTLIENKLLNDERMAKAGELASRVHEDIRSGTPFEEAAVADSLEVTETEPFTRSGSVTGVGRDASFIGAAFALDEVGEVSAPVKGTRGYYIIKLLEKDAFDEADYNAKKDQLAAQLRQRRASQAFTQWYTDIREKAEIKDYRARYYN